MSEKENILLTDRQIYPSEEVIFSIIGEKKIFWEALMKYMSDNYAGSSGDWNFYNDGKRWLFKMVFKKKTIFWAGLIKDGFRITFYFGKKADAIIGNSDLSDEIKEEFSTAKSYGLIRPMTFIVNQQKDIENVIKAIDIKVKLK